MQKYYLDTSILLDVYEKRGYNGEIALKLILKLIDANAIIIFSDEHIIELKSLGYSLHEINSLLRTFKQIAIEKVHLTKTQIRAAKKLAIQKIIPNGDALHSIIARDFDAIFISRDKYFENLDFLIFKKPEELL